jgi:uncharacterized protein YcfJ
MKPIVTSLIFLSAVGLAGSAAAAPELVGIRAMDRIVAQSSQEIRLADRRHDRYDRHDRYNRYDRHGHSHRRHRNDWIGPVVAGALIGAIIANQNSTVSRHRQHGGDSYRDAKRRCASDYRSYDWESDTYVTYGGTVKLCPYVRSYYR